MLPARQHVLTHRGDGFPSFPRNAIRRAREEEAARQEEAAHAREEEAARQEEGARARQEEAAACAHKEAAAEALAAQKSAKAADEEGAHPFRAGGHTRRKLRPGRVCRRHAPRAPNLLEPLLCGRRHRPRAPNECGGWA